METHEQGHLKNGKDAAEAVVAFMRNHRRAQTCSALRHTLETEGKKLVERGGRMDAKFDRKTSHGVTEGVAIQW